MNALITSVITLLRQDGFMPHGHCYLWQPELLALHVGSDAIIFISYIVIASAIAYVILTTKEVPLHIIFVLFGIFIFACGVTHLNEVINVWVPTYWLSGWVKALTATASAGTALVLCTKFRHIKQLARGAALHATNRQRKQIMREREQVLQLLAAAIPQIVWAAEPDGQHNYFNARWTEYTHLSLNID